METMERFDEHNSPTGSETGSEDSPDETQLHDSTEATVKVSTIV